ncbi:MAG: hypothetical protein ACYTEE_02700 [Planctomycetota bacterium]|jgi:hypothetical protein
MKKTILTILLVTILLLVAAPNALADDPDNPLQGDAPSDQDITKAEAEVSVVGSVVQVDPATIPCDTVADFEDVNGETGAGINYDGILLSGGLQLAERFTGQTLSFSGNFDVLSGFPSSPLALQTGDLNENVGVLGVFASGQIVVGQGPTGYPNWSAVGEGSLAILFPNPQSQFKFLIEGVDGGGSANLNFFKADGSLLGTIIIAPANQTYGFKHSLGIREIAGFSIHNTDPAGIGYDNICYESVIEVPIDIKPGSCPNPLNTKSKGVLPAAILGSEDVNVLEIDPASIRLVGVPPIRSSYEDVATPVAEPCECECNTEGPDAFLDLTLKFETQEIVEAIGDVNHGDILELPLTGALFDGTPIEGADCIIIRGNQKLPHAADINKDGTINLDDLVIFKDGWKESMEEMKGKK